MFMYTFCVSKLVIKNIIKQIFGDVYSTWKSLNFHVELTGTYRGCQLSQSWDLQQLHCQSKSKWQL
jgi:hypothetical protein